MKHRPSPAGKTAIGVCNGNQDGGSEEFQLCARTEGISRLVGPVEGRGTLEPAGLNGDEQQRHAPCQACRPGQLITMYSRNLYLIPNLIGHGGPTSQARGVVGPFYVANLRRRPEKVFKLKI